MTLLYLVAAWVAGIFLASTGTQTPVTLWIALAVVSIILAYTNRAHRFWRLTFICGMLFTLGAGRYAWATRTLPANHIAHYVDSGYVTLTGIIARDADIRDKHVNLHIHVESLLLKKQQEITAQGHILVQAPRHGSYAYGDRVTVAGQLLTPPEFDDFSYRDYLARRNIHALMPNARITILAHDQGRPWYSVMYALKQRAQQTINRLLPSPQAPLLSGILLGVETGIPPDVREAFNQTGTTHIIAISGANIIVVIRVLLGLLSPALGTRRAGWITLIGVSIYTVFVGADPAVVRAAIMGGLVLFASQSGRRTHGLTSLAFAIWLMSLWNPLTLWDVGFQLSVAATTGLVLFSNDFTARFEQLFQRAFAPETARQITHWISEPVIISLAAQITTTPLILVYFGRLSIISLLANILIVPVQAYIMTLGWLAVLLGMVWTGLGEPLAWVVWIPLAYTIRIVRSLSTFEWASVTWNFPASSAWGSYAVLLGLALFIIQHPEDRAELWQHLKQRITTYLIFIVGVVLIILIWATVRGQPDGKLHVWFLDVGHGHAVLIQTPNGAQILIDGGPNPTRLQHAVGSALPFWDRHLDLMIVTQPKSASINALPPLLERYTVALALTNGQPADHGSYRALIRAWEAHNIDILIVTAGYRVQTSDGVLLEILHPQTPPDENTSAKTAGLVIRASYGDTSFLLTPDLNTEAEQLLLEAGWYAGSTVLELPAHGSSKANSDSFLNAVYPQAAVVIVGAGNRSGLPAPDVQTRLKNITDTPLYRTDHHGTIEMVTDGRTLWVHTGN